MLLTSFSYFAAAICNPEVRTPLIVADIVMFVIGLYTKVAMMPVNNTIKDKVDVHATEIITPGLLGTFLAS